jgi:predicted dehydrogenase/threonine dehydrogenase-like Zn-dependent dehydrogenase
MSMLEMNAIGAALVRQRAIPIIEAGTDSAATSQWQPARNHLKQIIQNVRSGELSLKELPAPLARPGQVLIANAASLISAGTEKMVMELASKSLIGKARERPDHVRRVIQKLKTDGFFETIRQVREKLDEPLPMGYSSAGIVLACGEGVQQYKVGDRVASNGPHAGVVSVPVNLCARVPDGVPFEQAAFAVLGSIALQGVRLSRAVLGETVFVIGLGLVGQLAVSLLAAAGCRVIGTDLDPAKCALARKMGAADAAPGMGASAVLDRTGGLGADAVIITASTDSNAPIEIAADAVRTKGRVVLVGVVGLNLPRRPFYFKEAEFVVSCSYGPGRYDPNYEQRGQDYPAGHVRWTEQRNIQAVLDLIAAGRLDVTPLISHRFPIDRAEDAYRIIKEQSEPYLGIILQYPEVQPTELKRVVALQHAPASNGHIGIGCLGAGNFARMTLLPAIQKIGGLRPHVLCSAGGLSAAHAGEKLGFASVTTDEDAVFADPAVSAVFALTRHDQHARQVVKGVRAGKHVFVEKPLAVTLEQLAEIESALAEAGERAPMVMVGFNRRFSPAAVSVRAHFAKVIAPLTVFIRFNAGVIPAEHWTQDLEEGGGRIIGEACHAIDLATYLTGSLPVRVYGESISGPAAPAITDDQAFLTVRHANGSISCIGYLAGGDKAMPKERIEVLGGGRMAVIDDFRTVQLSAGGTVKTSKTSGKGHAEEVAAFIEAIRSGGRAPIPWDELRSTTVASILAVRSLREGVPLELTASAADQE